VNKIFVSAIPWGWPEKLNFLELPFRVGKLDVVDECLVVHPRADHDLSVLTPRERWRFEWQRQRLERRGIKMRTVKGEVGSWR
jgi:hypothetical protein